MQAWAADSSLNRTVRIPSSSFCVLEKGAVSLQYSRAIWQQGKTDIVQRHVGHFPQRLALIPHFLLEIQQQSSIVFQFFEREHPLKDDQSTVFRSGSNRRCVFFV